MDTLEGPIPHTIRTGAEAPFVRLLDGNPTLVSTKVEGYWPLGVAAWHGQLGMVRVLVQRGANVNAVGSGGKTALHWAAQAGHQTVVAFLLSRNARADHGDNASRTPLELASEGGHMGVVIMLIQYLGQREKDGGVRVATTALHLSAREGHMKLTKMLLSKGAQVGEGGVDGRKILLDACSKGHLSIVKMIVQRTRAELLEGRDQGGQTALYHAAIEGHEAIVAFLLSKGAQANIKDSEGVTVLMGASMGGHLGIVKMVQQHMEGEGLEERDTKGRTALCHAAIQGHETVVAFLLDEGAQAGWRDNQGSTALMRASIAGHLGVVQVLVQHTGEERLEDKDLKGHTALYHAAVNGHETVVAFLMSNGAQARWRDNQGRTALIEACSKGRLGMVQAFVEHMEAERLEEKRPGGRTALYYAAQGGYLDVVNLLLSKGAQANVKDNGGRTVLMGASEMGHLGVVRRLVQHMGKEGLEDKDLKGHTALYFAAVNGHEKVVAFLVSKGARPRWRHNQGRTALIEACSKGHLGMVQAFVQHMEAGMMEKRDRQGGTALCHAAVKGHKKIVAVLLSKGAQANVKDAEGRTALMRAAMGGHLGVVQMLGEEGLEERDNGGCTALYHAAQGGHETVAAFLMSKGAQAEWRGYLGKTALMNACSSGRLGMVQLFVQHMGDEGLEERDMQRYTALYHAAEGGHTAIVTFLLSKGAQASSRDLQGITTLMRAAQKGHLDVTRVLVRHMGGQGLNEREESTGRTALHWAVRSDWIHRSHEEMVRFLLVSGADPTITDNQGRTPRALAEEQHQASIVADFQRWELELERRHILYRARCLHKAHTMHRDMPISHVPAYLKARVAAGHALPSVEVVSPLSQERPQQEAGASGKRKAADESGDQQESVVDGEEVHAVLEYVLKALNEELSTELLEGFH